MAQITRNFTSEGPLHLAAREALESAFDQGWADPRKLSHQSAKARVLKNEAIESIASNLHISAEKLEFIGEARLGHYYSIAGLLRPQDLLLHSVVDKSEILALARSRASMGLPVSLDGQIDISPALAPPSVDRVFAVQIANGETGVIQNYTEIIREFPEARIACDFSSAGIALPLPERWDSAFFDSKSWQGPEGVGILAINSAHKWINPLPHIGPARVPGSVSLPLIMASAIALVAKKKEFDGQAIRLREISKYLRKEISSTIAHCDIAGNLESSLPHINSLSFLYVEGEELLRQLDNAGYALDSGSACSADDLAPSHVLAAMGVLTHGNIRITLHASSTQDEVRDLVQEIRRVVEGIRSR